MSVLLVLSHELTRGVGSYNVCKICYLIPVNILQNTKTECVCNLNLNKDLKNT